MCAVLGTGRVGSSDLCRALCADVHCGRQGLNGVCCVCACGLLYRELSFTAEVYLRLIIHRCRSVLMAFVFPWLSCSHLQEGSDRLRICTLETWKSSQRDVSTFAII